MLYTLLYALLGLGCFGLVGLLFGTYFTRRIYQPKLTAAQAQAEAAEADAKDAMVLAARWKKLYYRRLDLA